MEPARVRVATCANGAEAALVRSLLSAHDIHVHVSGEQHAAMMGGLAGSFISLDVWVDREDADDAAELIAGMREGVDADLALPDSEEPEGELADGEIAPDDDVPDPGPAIERRRGTGVVLILACCVTFGTAHMYTRAWMRGISLAAIEVVAIAQLGSNPVLGGAMLGAAVLADLIGALIRVRGGARRVPLPRARLLS